MYNPNYINRNTIQGLMFSSCRRGFASHVNEGPYVSTSTETDPKTIDAEITKGWWNDFQKKRQIMMKHYWEDNNDY